MKKVTLGAVVWALAMMGCSESGMDNSVTSANEVKSENIMPFLAKSGQETCVNPYDAANPFGREQSAVSCGGYRAFFSSMKDRWEDENYWVRTNVGVYEEDENGKVNIKKKAIADFVAITVCGVNCRVVGDDVECDKVSGPHKRVWSNDWTVTFTCDILQDVFGYGRGRVGIITTLAAIVNNGTNNSKTLMATTTTGFSSEDVASKMYWKYMNNYSGN